MFRRQTLAHGPAVDYGRLSARSTGPPKRCKRHLGLGAPAAGHRTHLDGEPSSLSSANSLTTFAARLVHWGLGLGSGHPDVLVHLGHHHLPRPIGPGRGRNGVVNPQMKTKNEKESVRKEPMGKRVALLAIVFLLALAPFGQVVARDNGMWNSSGGCGCHGGTGVWRNSPDCPLLTWRRRPTR